LTSFQLDFMTSNNQHLSLFHRPRHGHLTGRSQATTPCPRLRRTASLRRMVQENQLTVNDLIYPVFVMEGENQEEEIPSMPEIYRYSLDLLLKEIADAANLGINAIALFPLISTDKKDNAGTES
jgi:porphobilinogen synthase